MVLIVHNMVLLGRKVVVGFYVEPFTVPPKGKSRAQKSVCVYAPSTDLISISNAPGWGWY